MRVRVTLLGGGDSDQLLVCERERLASFWLPHYLPNREDVALDYTLSETS